MSFLSSYGFAFTPPAPRRRCVDIDDPDDEDWYPLQPSGKQKSPEVIRGEIIRYCQETGKSRTAFMKEVGLNSSVFGRFMNQKYKDPWSAVQNTTYMTAARFLAKWRLEKKKNRSKKRGREDDGAVAADTFREKKKKGLEELDRIAAVDLPHHVPVYMSCDVLRGEVTKYLIASGVPVSRFCAAIGISAANLASFRKHKGKGAGAGSVAYPAAYRFLEQKRILERKPKTKKRLEAEARWGSQGYRLEHDNGSRWVFKGMEHDRSIFDIDACRDRYNARSW